MLRTYVHDECIRALLEGNIASAFSVQREGFYGRICTMSKKPKPPITDPAHDVLRYERQPLDAIFNPEAVALVGATERPGSVRRTIMWNLVSNPFGGTVFPVM